MTLSRSFLAIPLIAALLLGLSGEAHAKKKTRDTAANVIQYFVSQHESYSSGGRVAAPAIAESENFAIHYLPHHYDDLPWIDRRAYPGWIFFNTDRVPAYVLKVMEELEFAHLRLLELGFPEPSFGRDKLISVFLVAPEKLEGGRALVTAFSLAQKLENWPKGDYILLPTGMDEVRMKATTAHEVFHIFQDSPTRGGMESLLWLMEGTAVWAEDAVHPRLEGRSGYLGGQTDIWWREFGIAASPFPGLGNVREKRNDNLWYGGGVLYKWWTTHLDRGKTLMPEIWARGLRAGNARKRVAEVVAAHSPGGKGFPFEFLRAAVAAYLGNPPEPYRLPRGNQAFTPAPTVGGPFELGRFDGKTGALAPEALTLHSFAALYRRIAAKNMDRPSTEKSLHIALAPSDDDDLRLALVEASSRFDGGEGSNRRVTLLETGGSYVIPRFAEAPDGTALVDLVAVNGVVADVSRDLNWTFAVGGPPVLEAVTVKAAGETVYDAEWITPPPPDRVLKASDLDLYAPTFEERTNALPGHAPLSAVTVTLHFSKPVTTPLARLGERVLQPEGAVTDLKADWTLTADAVEVVGEDLQLAVDAMDRNAMHLDASPATPARLRADARGWDFYEGPMGERAGHGGEDRMHILRVAGEGVGLRSATFRYGDQIYYQADWKDGQWVRSLDKPVTPGGKTAREGVWELTFRSPMKRVYLSFGGRAGVDAALFEGGKKARLPISASTMNDFFNAPGEVVLAIRIPHGPDKPFDRDNSQRVLIEAHGEAETGASNAFRAVPLLSLDDAAEILGDKVVDYSISGTGAIKYEGYNEEPHVLFWPPGASLSHLGNMKDIHQIVSDSGDMLFVEFASRKGEGGGWTRVRAVYEILHSVAFAEGIWLNTPQDERLNRQVPGFDAVIPKRNEVDAKEGLIEVEAYLGRMKVLITCRRGNPAPQTTDALWETLARAGAVISRNLAKIEFVESGNLYAPRRLQSTMDELKKYASPQPSPEKPTLPRPQLPTGLPPGMEPGADPLARMEKNFRAMPPEAQRQALDKLRALPPARIKELPPFLRKLLEEGQSE